jgi:hypothetical protein
MEGSDFSEEQIYPECEGHNEVQHRDGKPPWCDYCGWNRGVQIEPTKWGFGWRSRREQSGES